MVFAWVGNYGVRMALSAVLPAIMQELDLSYSGAGVLATAFFYSYAVMNFPAGLLGDRFGSRRVLVIGLVAGGLFAMATGLATSFGALLAARLMTGVSQGCLFSNDRAIIVAVTPPGKITLGQAVSFTGPGLGIGLGLFLGGALAEVMSWRWVLALLGVLPIVAALLIVRFVPRPPSPSARAMRRGRVRSVVTDRTVWVLSLAGATVMWVQFVVILWGPLLFMEIGVTTLARAGLFSSLTGLAAVIGLLLGGAAGQAAQRRGRTQYAVLLPAFAAMAVTASGTALALQGRALPAVLAAGVFLTTIFAWSVWGPMWALLGQTFKDGDVSSAFGLSNTITVVGAIVGPALAGWARDVTGSFAFGLYLSAAVALAGGLTLAVFSRSGRARPSAA